MKVVIVAKTRKGSGACVGGLTFDGRSVRLVHPQEALVDQFNMEYEIGDVWEINAREDPSQTPPHVENILTSGGRKLPAIDDVAAFASSHMPPRAGGIDALFDGLAQSTKAGALYIAERTGVPPYSTMLWRPDQPLVRDDDTKRIRYRYPGEDGGHTLTFVGFQEPLTEIPPGALLRVSLAHWWRPEEMPDGELRCYVQLSGWYDEESVDFGYDPAFSMETGDLAEQWTDEMPPVPEMSPLTNNDTALRTLKDVFGYDSFREPQADIIANIAAKRDTLAVMPTGRGKSLCYQLPALHFAGVTVVVSPLISLMEDQVAQLRELGIPAAFLNSTLSYHEDLRVRQQVKQGRIKLLYAAPETLLRPETLLLLQNSRVDCLTIDEAHCISEWGHDFRPEYRQLLDLRERLPDAVCLAVTATATDRVRTDIKKTLSIGDADEFISSFDRENLMLAVDDRIDPLNQTVAFLKAHREEAGIIYCTTRARVDELSDALARRGFPVLPYHAGLDEATRRENQRRFSREEGQIVVATIAFGMGINKSNVRFILHHDLPSNLESYYQQIGRAGRDGLRADCLLLFDPQDTNTIQFFINNMHPDQRPGAQTRLQSIVAYAETNACRRKPLLGYFGEPYEPDSCGRCDNCVGEDVELVDLTIPAQKFLSCVVRTGERFGATYIIDILRGSRAQRILSNGHDQVSTYDIGREFSKRQWQHLARQFVRRGILIQDPQHGGLWLSVAGRQVLQGERFRGEQPPKEQVYAQAGPQDAYDRDLFARLREKRTELASEQGVPPYVIFSDRALAGMATIYPRTAEQFLSINGIGRHKLETYGELFMPIIRTYMAENDIAPPEPQPSLLSSRPAAQATTRSNRSRTEQVVSALKAGQTREEIAAQHNISTSTVANHLWMAVRAGESVQAAQVPLPPPLSPANLQRLYEALAAHGLDRLVTVHDAFEGEFDYEHIQLAAVHYLIDHPQEGYEPSDLADAAAVIVDAVNLLPGVLPRSSMTKLLLGRSSVRLDGLTDHPVYGSLSHLNYYVVMREIDNLIAAGVIDHISSRLHPGAGAD